MIDRRCLMAKLSACSLLAMNAMFFSGSAAWAVRSPIKAFDKDKDGTLDLAEVKEAGDKMFDKLDKNGDGTLSLKEVGTRVSKTDFKAADADHDGTLTKDEYFTIVEKLFSAADVDKDGTLSAQELQSKAGHALLHLMQ
jgi:Ca2+-binding EF-hand superfamily protein